MTRKLILWKLHKGNYTYVTICHKGNYIYVTYNHYICEYLCVCMCVCMYHYNSMHLKSLWTPLFSTRSSLNILFSRTRNLKLLILFSSLRSLLSLENNLNLEVPVWLKYIKKCSIPLAVREIQFRQHWESILPHKQWPSSRNWIIKNASGAVGKRNLSTLLVEK